MSIPRLFVRFAISWALLFGLAATADLHNQAAADETPQQTKSAAEDAADRNAELPNALVLRRTLEGHQTDVRCLAFSPDGKTLASGSYGQPADDGGYLGYVKFWDVASGKETKSLGAHSNSVLGLAFTPDGKQLVTGGADEKIRLWNLENYKYVKTFSGHTDAVYGVAVSPSGKSIASASYDDTVRVWEIESGRERFTLDAHTDDVTAVAFSPDSKTLASVSHDETVRLWGPKTAALEGHEWWVVSARFSPDGKLLATGSWDDTAILWDVAKQEKVAVLDAETSQGVYVAFTPDGRTLITAGPGVGTSAIIKIWDVETHQARATIDPGDGLLWAIDVSPDGKYLATGSGELIKLWELTTQRPEDLPPLNLDKSQIFGFLDDRLEIKNDYLTQQGGIHPDLIKAVKDVEGVTQISVMNTRITDAGFAQLAELPWVDQVESLNLMSTQITDASLAKLSKFPALSELYLSGCEKFTDDGLAALKGLDELANLQLGGTRVGDAGLKHIGQLKNLEVLGLASSQVTDAGLPQLAGLDQLRVLNLSYCRISDAGLKPLAGLSALESLELNDGYALNERVSNITGSGLRHLAKLSKLRMLDLDHTKVNDEGLSHLAPLSQLESLSLHGTKISDAAARHFGPFKNLETLDVEDTQVGDEVMKAVSQLSELEDLTIEETQVTDAGLAHLAQLKNLKSLWLEDSKVTHEGVQQLRKALPELDVEGTPRPVMQEHFVEADPLAELDFSTEYHQIHALAYSPDGKRLAAGGETGFGEDVHGAVKLWDAKSKKLLDSFELGQAVYWLSFSEDGSLLVASGKERETGKVWFRDVAAKKVTHKLEHGKSVRRAELLPEGKICFTAALLSEPPLSDADVKLWDWQAGKETADFEDASHVSAVSPDGKLLATTAKFASTVELIDLKTKEKAATFEYAKDPDIVEADYLSINTTPLMFRADGKQIALGISEPISELSYAPVKTWNVETGEKGPTLKQYAVLQSVAYSPDGSRIATSGHLSEIGATPRGRVKLFDAKSGDVLCTIERRLSLVNCVRFSPDGKLLAAAFNDKVRVWEIDKLLAAAKE